MTPPTPTARVLAALGGWFAKAMIGLGDWSLFSAQAVRGVLGRAFGRREMLRICVEVGSNSVGVVAVTGLFIGMVLAVQTYSQFHSIGLETSLGAVIHLSVVRELGPVLAATMLAGRVGSVIAIGFVLVGVGVVTLPAPFTGLGPNFGLVLVGGVVFVLGRAELTQVRAVEAHRARARRTGWVAVDPGYEPPLAEVISPPPFTGWKFDPVRKVWSEWIDGVLVREVHAI